jgi:hypothetical protein
MGYVFWDKVLVSPLIILEMILRIAQIQLCYRCFVGELSWLFLLTSSHARMRLPAILGSAACLFRATSPAAEETEPEKAKPPVQPSSQP